VLATERQCFLAQQRRAVLVGKLQVAAHVLDAHLARQVPLALVLQQNHLVLVGGRQNLLGALPATRFGSKMRKKKRKRKNEERKKESKKERREVRKKERKKGRKGERMKERRK